MRKSARRVVSRKSVSVEPLESRRLLAWGASAQVMDQDVAASSYPTTTGSGVTIAILDTGVDYSHPALGGGFGQGFKVKGGYDFVDNDADPMDTFGHGTNVAGVIAASAFSTSGADYRGIAPGASIVALRVSSDGTSVTSDTIVQALQWIETNRVAMGISIVNFSFGAGTYTGAQTDPQTSDVFADLKAAGVFFVSPSGNGGTGGGQGINWPAADPSVVSVGSVNTSDQISSFTQRGSNLDLLAPGEALGTTVRGGGFTLVTLSSFSSPVIAGAAALIRQSDPSVTPDDILSNLRASGVRKDDTSFGSKQSYARVDLDNAITLALQRKPNAGTDVGVNGEASDMAFDDQGVLHFVYYDKAIRNIKYATRNTSGAWSATRTIDITGNDVGAHLSMALDWLGKPSIAYYDNTEGDVEYARFNGASFSRSTLDSKNTTGQYCQIAFDNDDNPFVTYYRKTSGDLRISRSNGSAWTRTSVDVDGNTGHYNSPAVAGNGTIGVSYVDATAGDVKYAQWNGSSWTIQTVDDLQGAAWTSLTFDNSNQPRISYYDAFNADLKYASRVAGTFSPTRIGGKGAVGLFSNIWLDETQTVNILYYSRKANGLYRVFESSGAWGAEEIKLTGGSLASLAVTESHAKAAYAYYDTVSQKVMTGDLT